MVKVGARVWLARIMVTWGIIAAGMAFISGETSFLIMRALLGAAEAGFFPGIIFYLTLWFPGTYRARVTGLFMACIPLSAAIGAMAVAAWQYVAMLRKVVAENEQRNWVAIAVDAAEQRLGDQAGQTRLDWVMTQLKARYPRLDTTTVRAMVEAHVKRMNQVRP